MYQLPKDQVYLMALLSCYNRQVPIGSNTPCNTAELFWNGLRIVRIQGVDLASNFIQIIEHLCAVRDESDP